MTESLTLTMLFTVTSASTLAAAEPVRALATNRFALGRTAALDEVAILTSPVTDSICALSRLTFASESTLISDNPTPTPKPETLSTLTLSSASPPVNASIRIALKLSFPSA